MTRSKSLSSDPKVIWVEAWSYFLWWADAVLEAMLDEYQRERT